MHTADRKGTKALSGTACEAQPDLAAGQSAIAPAPGDRSGECRANGAIDVRDRQFNLVLSADAPVCCGGIGLGDDPLVERRCLRRPLHAIPACTTIQIGTLQQWAQVELVGACIACDDLFQQFGATDDLLQTVGAEFGQHLADFLGDMSEEVHHRFGRAGELRA